MSKRIRPIIGVFINTVFFGDDATALLGLLEITSTSFSIGFRVLINWHLRHIAVLVSKLSVNRLNGHGKSVTGEGLEHSVLFNTMHGEGTDTEGDIGSSETVLLKNLINLLRSLDSDRVPIKGLDVRIKYLITLGIDSTTKNVPEMEYGLGNISVTTFIQSPESPRTSMHPL